MGVGVPATAPPETTYADPLSFEAVVALADEKRDAKLRAALELFVRIVRFEPGRIEMALAENAPGDLVHDLSKKLAEWTGRRWVVAVSREDGAPTLREQKQAARAERIDGMRRHPVVTAVLDAFPGAEIVDVRETCPSPDRSAKSDDPEHNDVETGRPMVDDA